MNCPPRIPAGSLNKGQSDRKREALSGAHPISGIVPTFHPGNRAMIACNLETRAYRTEHRRRAMLKVKAALTE